MFKDIIKSLFEIFKEHSKNESIKESKIVSIIEEIEELEIKYARKITEAERWGDINDKSDWRVAEANEIRRIIESKERLIEKLKSI